MSAKVTVIIYILICFEVGALLAILPWTVYWEENFFLYFISGKLQATWLAAWLQSGYARGAVTGLGVINVLAGLHDMLKFRESVQVLKDLEMPSEGTAKQTIVESTVSPSATLSDHQSPNVPPRA